MKAAGSNNIVFVARCSTYSNNRAKYHADAKVRDAKAEFRGNLGVDGGSKQHDRPQVEVHQGSDKVSPATYSSCQECKN